MDNLITQLKNNDILIPLRFFGNQDFSTGWDAKSVIDNNAFFAELYSDATITGIKDINDFFFYLFSLKIVSLREIIPQLIQEEHKTIVAEIADRAKRTIKEIEKGDVIKFINDCFLLIFKENIFDSFVYEHEMRIVTIDLIAKYCKGINKSVFEFLCLNYGGFLINQFDQFELVFEANPDLFDIIYPLEHHEERFFFHLDKTLDIWFHIIVKKKSQLKGNVEKNIEILAEDIKELVEKATIDNIMQVEGPIRIFHFFLQRIRSPKANEFFDYAKTAENLLSKYIVEKGQLFQYELPINEIVTRWKKIKHWYVRLLTLTHDHSIDNDIISFVSRLSNPPEKKHPIIDCVSTNIPTDDYFTVSHQRMLSIYESLGTATIMDIIRKEDTSVEYFNLVASAISIISDDLDIKGEQLQQDIVLLISMVQLVINNMNTEDECLQGLCYGASMFICAFTEKLLRTFYMQLAKDDIYIPINKATLGELLSVSNQYMVNIFGEDHIKSLLFFLHQDSTSKIGHNLRNSLAHWANLTPHTMTPYFVARLLWLFTDILNTIFAYCITEGDNNDQL